MRKPLSLFRWHPSRSCPLCRYVAKSWAEGSESAKARPVVISQRPLFQEFVPSSQRLNAPTFLPKCLDRRAESTPDRRLGLLPYETQCHYSVQGAEKRR